MPTTFNQPSTYKEFMRLESVSGVVLPALPSFYTLAKSAAVMTVAALAIEAFQRLTVEAGPVSYAACLATCVPATLAGGPATAACVAVCLPALVPWLP